MEKIWSKPRNVGMVKQKWILRYFINKIKLVTNQMLVSVFSLLLFLILLFLNFHCSKVTPLLILCHPMSNFLSIFSPPSPSQAPLPQQPPGFLRPKKKRRGIFLHTRDGSTAYSASTNFAKSKIFKSPKGRNFSGNLGGLLFPPFGCPVGS